MKKILFIFLICFSFFVQAEIDYSQSVDQIVESQSLISQDTQSLNSEVGQMRNMTEDIFDLLYNALYDEYSPNIISMLAWIDGHIEDFRYFFTTEWYNFMYENFSATTGYLYDLKNAFLDGLNVYLPEDWATVITPFLESIDINIGGLAENFEGFNTSSERTNTILEDIRGLVGEIVGNTTSSNAPLSTATISFSLLDDYGVDVDTSKVLPSSFQTTGEFNKDVHQLLIGLNQISASENNALLSILTNIQCIVSTLSNSADIQKVEQDLNERESSIQSAQDELSNIENQSWDSFFTPPTFLSDVYNSLQVSVNPSQLPDRIEIIETFHFDSPTVTYDISQVGFTIPHHIRDLVEYARTVFAFVYWSLTFLIALFLIKLWIRLYSFILNAMIKT